MDVTLLKSKLHGITVTATGLQYDGSITIDSELLKQANMFPGEQVHVLNVNNGARFITYTIPAPAHSGKVILNGPAARLGAVGDTLIILAYCELSSQEAVLYQPTLRYVDENNMIRRNNNF